MTGVVLYRVEVDEYDKARGVVNRVAVSRDFATLEQAKKQARTLADHNRGKNFLVVRVDTVSVTRGEDMPVPRVTHEQPRDVDGEGD